MEKQALAPRGFRFLAYLVDWAVMYAVQQVGGVLGAGVAAVVLAWRDAPERVIVDSYEGGMVWGVFFWGMAAWLINYGALQGMTGCTVGKRLFGIRVVNLDGSPIGVMKSLGRTVSYIFSMLPLYLGFLAILWNERGRAWHDTICGTIVIRRKAAYPVAVAPGADVVAMPMGSEGGKAA